MANNMKYPNTTVGAALQEGRPGAGEVHPVQGRRRDAREPTCGYNRTSPVTPINEIHSDAPHTQRRETTPQDREAPPQAEPRSRRRRSRPSGKTVDVALKAGDAAKTATEFKTTQAMLDRAADKGYIHPNKAARLKSRLVKRMRAASAAPAKA